MKPQGRNQGSGNAKIVIDDLVTKKVQVSGVHPNVEQEVLLVTEDKVRLCLNDNFQRAARSKQWITVGGMILTFLLTLTTAEFRDFGALKSQEWRGVMIAALALSLAWFVVTVRWATKAPTIEQIVSELKEGSHKIAQEERVLSMGDEEVILVPRRPPRLPAEEIGAQELDSWSNPLKSPMPEEFRKPLILAMQAYRTKLGETPNDGDLFLNRRGIGGGTRETLRLGFAPNEWEFLLKKLQGTASPELLAKAGLVTPRQSTPGYFDRFRARVIIPVEYREALCGFVGVSVDGTDPVLLFSPEGQFFTKDVAIAYIRSSPELRAITGL